MPLQASAPLYNKEGAVLGDSAGLSSPSALLRSVCLSKSSRAHVAPGGVGRRVRTAHREERRKGLEDRTCGFGCGRRGGEGRGKEETQEEEGPRGGGGDQTQPRALSGFLLLSSKPLTFLQTSRLPRAHLLPACPPLRYVRPLPCLSLLWACTPCTLPHSSLCTRKRSCVGRSPGAGDSILVLLKGRDSDFHAPQVKLRSCGLPFGIAESNPITLREYFPPCLSLRLSLGFQRLPLPNGGPPLPS